MGVREVAAGTLAALATLVCPRTCAAYRPFVSTDAAVAERRTAEVELGYFELARESGRSSYVAPHIVLNYGIATDVEAVGELSVEEPSDEATGLSEPSVSLKAVLHRGVLQDGSGLTVAAEVGALLPGTLEHQSHIGFEGVGIVSGGSPPEARAISDWRTG